MGQQQSAEKGSGSKGGTGHDPHKKVNRRISVQALPISKGRASPADPSASTANAVAHTTSQHLGKAPLQQYIQSSSPDGSSKSSKVARSTSKASKETKGDVDHRPHESEPLAVPQPSGPMNVPVSRSKQDDFDDKPFNKPAFEDDQSAYHERRYTPMAQTRPPRLPLPIADVVTIPESPTLPPVDKGNADVPIFETDDPLSAVEPQLRRKSSMMSTNTQDDEDVEEELPAVDPTSQTVPTTIEWNQSGHKVYVTGTFANWERKYRLHHRKDGPGLAATINLPPGTHHLMFLVDDRMTTNADLPTCVDFNNVLVNYIELATEDVFKPRRESNQTVTAKDSAQAAHPASVSEQQEGQQDADEAPADDQDLEPMAEEVAPGDFRQIIPHALVDIDLAEDDPRYHQASRVIGDCQGPPSLPMFLSRSILNGILPVKDDSSVLALPNHTVLNHLMTSSVKNGVLATSVTTRYKKKYVTTISFKPVPKFQAAV